MSRVLTNSTSFAIVYEESMGVLPTTPSWHLIEPNAPSDVGSKIATVAREPISKSRQNRKGGVTDLDSMFGAELDLTREHLLYLLPPAMFSEWVGAPSFRPTAVTATGYTVASGGDLLEGTLVVPTGFTIAGNNSPASFKVVVAGSLAAEVRTAGLAAETVAADGSQNALLEVAGFRGAAGTIQINSGGNLLSVSGVDFTSAKLRLRVGQFIWVGGTTIGTSFAITANRGLARITSISPTVLGLDKKSSTFATDNGSGKTIDLYFGRWIRNVDVDHADFVEQYMQVEVAMAELGGAATPMYLYPRGNLLSTLELGIPGQSKGTMTIGLVGTDTADPTETRAAEADTPVLPRQVTMYNTSSDLTRLRVTEVDETGVTSEFTELTLTLDNKVSPEKIIGLLGARYMNYGNFTVTASGNVVLTDDAVMAAVRANTLMTAEIGFRNDDGAFVIDLPSITLGDGAPDFPPDQSVMLAIKLDAVQDVTYGYTMSVTTFPYLPAA